MGLPMHILIACLVAFLAVVPARAQDDETERRAVLAERLIDATARDLLHKSMTDMIERQAATLEALPDEQRLADP